MAVVELTPIVTPPEMFSSFPPPMTIVLTVVLLVWTISELKLALPLLRSSLEPPAAAKAPI